MSDTMSPAVAFFHEHAGYSYDPASETPEQGRRRGAEALATAEQAGREAGLTFSWSVDPDHDSSEWSDERPAWQQWQCLAMIDDGSPDSIETVASLHGIDFGRDRDPWSDPYRRVVEAQLAAEYLSEREHDAETKAWRDAYHVAYIGASNTAGAAHTIGETISALRQAGLPSTDIDSHPAVRAMVGHLAYLVGIGIGPESDDLDAVTAHHTAKQQS